MAAADPIGGRVFMAGDWFSYWPGWQVGALDSAHLATDQIARAAYWIGRREDTWVADGDGVDAALP